MKKLSTWRLGDVVQIFDDAFGYGIVTHIDDEGYATVARPYAYASETSNSPLIGVETMTRLSFASWKHRIVDNRPPR